MSSGTGWSFVVDFPWHFKILFYILERRILFLYIFSWLKHLKIEIILWKFFRSCLCSPWLEFYLKPVFENSNRRVTSWKFRKHPVVNLTSIRLKMRDDKRIIAKQGAILPIIIPVIAAVKLYLEAKFNHTITKSYLYVCWG